MKKISLIPLILLCLTMVGYTSINQSPVKNATKICYANSTVIKCYPLNHSIEKKSQKKKESNSYWFGIAITSAIISALLTG